MKIYYYEGQGNETLVISGRCPECDKNLSQGRVYMNELGDVNFQDWICKVCGEVRPVFDRI